MDLNLIVKHIITQTNEEGQYDSPSFKCFKIDSNEIIYDEKGLLKWGSVTPVNDHLVNYVTAAYEAAYPETILLTNPNNYLHNLHERYSLPPLQNNKPLFKYHDLLAVLANRILDGKPCDPYIKWQGSIKEENPAVYADTNNKVWASKYGHSIEWFASNAGYDGFGTQDVIALLEKLKAVADITNRKIEVKSGMMILAYKNDSILRSFFMLFAKELGNKVSSKEILRELMVDQGRLISYVGKRNALRLEKYLREPDNNTLPELGVAILNSKELNADSKVSTTDLNTYKTMARWFKLRGERAEKELKNVAGRYGTDIGSIFAVKPKFKQSQSDIIKQIKKKFGEWPLSTETADKLRSKDPDSYKEYLSLRRDAVEQYRAFLKTIVRSSGNKYVSIPKVADKLKTEGIVWAYSLPEAWKDGSIGENGELYTSEGELLTGSYSGGEIKVNPNSRNGDWVIMFKPPFAQGFTRLYRASEQAAKKETKFSDIRKSVTQVKQARQKWMNDLKKGDVAAILVETVYQTQARIGANVSASAAGKRTYGLSTLQRKHFTFRPNGELLISYKGKKGVPQRHIIKPSADTKDLLKQLKRLWDHTKDPSDFVFVDRTKRERRVSSNDVNQYLKSLKIPFSVHKFRHLKGTTLALELISGSPLLNRSRSVDPKKAEQWYKDHVATKVGKLLGHKSPTRGGAVLWQTCVKSYIAPDVTLGFFKQIGVRAPKWAEKLATEKEED